MRDKRRTRTSLSTALVPEVAAANAKRRADEGDDGIGTVHGQPILADEAPPVTLEPGTVVMARVHGEGGRFRRALVLEQQQHGESRVRVRLVSSPQLELDICRDGDVVCGALGIGERVELQRGQHVFVRIEDGFFVPGQVISRGERDYYHIAYDDDLLRPTVRRRDIVLDDDVPSSSWRLRPAQAVGACWAWPALPLTPGADEGDDMDHDLNDISNAKRRRRSQVVWPDDATGARPWSLPNDPVYYKAIIESEPAPGLFLVKFFGVLEGYRLLPPSCLTLSARFWG